MALVLIGVLSLIFTGSLLVYKHLVGGKSNAVRWILWLVFVIWILVFGVGSIWMLRTYFPEIHKAIGVIPMVIGTLLYILRHRKSIAVGGFNKSDKG